MGLVNHILSIFRIIKGRFLRIDTIEHLIEDLVHFFDHRDQDQFYNSKDLALALSIKASELNELFLWNSPGYVNPDKVKEELADYNTPVFREKVKEPHQ